MDVRFSSKTVKVPEDLREFFSTKLSRLKKFSRSGLESVTVIVDRVKRGKSTTSDASVEVVADVKGKRMAFKDLGSNVHQAFFRAYEKIEKSLRRMTEKEKGK